ncbi:MAG TPA: carboxypeptidase-like regulatory domain-containing protein, partial [Pyrinomonadaceae bacterium]
MIQKIKFLPSILALLLCLTATAFGQETAGQIEGTITDPAGNVVPGVTVTVRSRGTTEGARQDATIGFNRTLTADENGFFRLTEVPPGFYTVTAAATSGFRSVVTNDVEVVLGKTTPVNIGLQTGDVSETVTVTSDVIAIDPTDNKIQTNITSQVAELLPKGTNINSLF